MKGEALYLRSIEYLKGMLFEKFPDAEIFLFGSRAKGDYGFNSDIDIGLQGDGVDLDKIREVLDIVEESFVPYHVDIVDFGQSDKGFVKAAMKGAIKWK